MSGCVNTMKENSVVQVGEVAIYILCWKIHWWVSSWGRMEKNISGEGIAKWKSLRREHTWPMFKEQWEG